MVKISPEWVTGPEQGKSSGRIATFSLCTGMFRDALDALMSQIYFWNKTLHVSDSSSVHHQKFFTVHTAMVYVKHVC